MNPRMIRGECGEHGSCDGEPVEGRGDPEVAGEDGFIGIARGPVQDGRVAFSDPEGERGEDVGHQVEEEDLQGGAAAAVRLRARRATRQTSR